MISSRCIGHKWKKHRKMGLLFLVKMRDCGKNRVNIVLSTTVQLYWTWCLGTEALPSVLCGAGCLFFPPWIGFRLFACLFVCLTISIGFCLRIDLAVRCKQIWLTGWLVGCAAETGYGESKRAIWRSQSKVWETSGHQHIVPPSQPTQMVLL